MSKRVEVKPKRKQWSDKLFKIGATVAGVYVLAIIVLMIFQLFSGFADNSHWRVLVLLRSEGRECF